MISTSARNHTLMTWKSKTLGNPAAGKLADSQDSVKFTFLEVDPRKEDFTLTATFEVEDASGADSQSGYGIAAVDTVASPNSYCRHRNHLLVGRFRSPEGHNYAYGLRVVGGYTDKDALPQDGHRKLDPSRLFPTQDDADVLTTGEKRRFRLEKTEDGFKATMFTGAGEESLSFPGHDFLLKQDREKIYVGFAIAGDIKIKVSEVVFETAPGSVRHTPRKAIMNHIPDYPFDRSLTEALSPSSGDDPMDLAAAIRRAAPGDEIILPDGIYKGGPYYIPQEISGRSGKPIVLKAEHQGKVILDGASFTLKLPVLTLRGNYWVIEGIVFRNSPSCGLFVCGSNNEIKLCEASLNGDTGILICSFPGTSKNKWPCRNRIERCFSHDNCDLVRGNADGFGAKLSVGKGNGFYYCRAYHNIDDGFDLYTKSTLGPIAPVTMKNCEAAFNGWLSGEDRPSDGAKTGIGFKLGGENQKVSHFVTRCAAHHNARIGFDDNSNPSPTLAFCEAWDNALDYKILEEKTPFLARYKARKRKLDSYLERKLIPMLMYKNPLSGNRSAVGKFKGLIPELESYYPQQINSQLCRQARINGFWSLNRYFKYVSSDQEALEKLRRNLTFLGSHFFRGEVWPRLRDVCREAFQGTTKEKIRVWCAGCSEGKEIYSILMVLLDFLPAEKIDLLATDYNLEMIQKSRRGVYPLSIIKEIPKEYRHYLGAFMPDVNDQFKSLKLLVPSSLRDQVRFGLQNLLTDDYPDGFDLILCRNVIKFFDEDARSRVQGKLAESLVDGGYLVVSDDLRQERIGDPESMGLSQVEGSCIYRKL